MRRCAILGVVVTGVTGCFDPTLRTGAPCVPDQPSCPADQVCTEHGGDFTCELPGTSFEPDAGIASPADAPPGSPDGVADAVPIPIHVEYVATVAECVNPAMPDPDYCRLANGSRQMVVDMNDTFTGEPWFAFVRFDLDDALAGKTVTAVRLRLTATDNARADGDDAGVVWAVDPFDLASLNTTTPQHVGAMLAPSQGAVGELDPVEWPLPASVPAANGAVHLGVETPSNDGVNYWNLAGPDPPRLIIDAM